MVIRGFYLGTDPVSSHLVDRWVGLSFLKPVTVFAKKLNGLGTEVCGYC